MRILSQRRIKLVASKERLTSASGLGTLVEAFDSSDLISEFKKCLPTRCSNRSKGSYRLALIQLSSFLYGHECLDDLIEFREDPNLEKVMKGETVVPRTMGNFLRAFEDEHLERLNEFISLQSKAYAEHLKVVYPQEFQAPLCLDIDSTPHVQSGEKMEGLAYNYKDLWCLDSQVVFDQSGLCWNLELREGNTKSGVGAERQIQTSLRHFKHGDNKQVRADSAYCNQEFIKTCLSLGSEFTITAHQGTMGWQNHIDEISRWEKWEYSPAQIKKANDRGKELEDIEVGRFYWRPSWSETLRFPVVVKRTPIKGQIDLFHGGYKYYGVVTNMSLLNKSIQSIFEHHQKRGNAENFIREEKYGYDLKHFPCQKLNANRAFGLLAMVAHNLLRFAALLDNPKKTKFAKKFRRSFITIPGKLVEHARSLTLQIPQRFIKEVQRLREGLQLNPEMNPAFPAGFSSG